MDIQPAEVVRRAVARDVKTLGSADAVRERYLRRYLPGQAIYLEGVRPHQLADAVVGNTNPAEPELTLR